MNDPRDIYTLVWEGDTGLGGMPLTLFVSLADTYYLLTLSQRRKVGEEGERRKEGKKEREEES